MSDFRTEDAFGLRFYLNSQKAYHSSRIVGIIDAQRIVTGCAEVVISPKMWMPIRLSDYFSTLSSPRNLA
jgi:hypothetical protein